MYQNKLAVWLCLAGALACGTTALAQNYRDRAYSAASLDGEFALVGSYTGGIARQLGVVRIDGGTVHGTMRVNVPGPTPTQRFVVPISFTGTARVAEDGTGVVTLKVNYPDGLPREATLDILITSITHEKGLKVAKRVEYMQRETPDLSPGVLIVGTLMRRPE